MALDSAELELKKLILDDDFTSLQNLAIDEVNLMYILRVSHKELQHSNFLAWFFNPRETHNLGDFAIKELFKIYFKEKQFQNLGYEKGISVFDFVHFDFDDLEIRREYKNIDLLFLSKKHQICIVIENKIYASEKEGQLQNYRNTIDSEYKDFKHKIYIFLSLKDQIITESEQEFYVQLSYEHIIKLIEQLFSNKRLKLVDKTRFVFEQYLQTLKYMLNKDEEIKKVAQQLYKKYKSAFDLVFEISHNNEIYTKLDELIKNEKTIQPFTSNKTYLRFQPKFLYENIQGLQKLGLLSETDNLLENWMFLFEFYVTSEQVVFDCKIGRGDQQNREKLFEIYKKNKNDFPLIDKGKGELKQWHQAFQKQMLFSNEYYEESTTIEKLLEERFRELIDKDLPRLMGAIEKEMKN